MSMDNPKAAKPQAESPPAKNKSSTDGRMAPLFRPVDWVTFLIVTLVVMAGYWLTLAPDLTLEDSGELAVASLYAGIPHPPGYPVWTVYTWLWAKLVPFSNIAWRVALGSAFAGAVACGLLGLIVSRGSSMMIEGIESLKAIERKWENAICVVSGFVAGCLIAFNGYMWSQSVIVEVYSLSMLSMVAVLVFLLRFIYAPQQHRYAYWAFFVFGICFTNHQSLLVMAMGIEACIAAANWKFGRALFFWNSVCYVLGLILWANKLIFQDTNPMIFFIFNVVGLLSIAAYIWFAIATRQAAGKEEWVAVVCGICWAAGAAFYLWMPIAGMSTPPMQWGYPRTVEGFLHALTRGQYEKANPSDLMSLDGWGRYTHQLWQMVEGVSEEFNWVYLFIALIPFLFFLRMQKRERAWVIGIFATYLCLGPLLVVLFNPSMDRQSRDLLKVFFTASHVLVAMGVGYGLTLIAASLATQYQRIRTWGIFGAATAAIIALASLNSAASDLMNPAGDSASLFSLFGHIQQAFAPNQYALPIFAGLILIALAVVFLAAMILRRERPAMSIVLCLFVVMPAHSFLNHWADNEQHGHLFGYWFGHDMFTPPFVDSKGNFSYDPKERAEAIKDPARAKFTYPEMTRDAILYGGTDPGRFCPTYMVFCESFTPANCKALDPHFDRRDVYIITQNALADHTYLMYLRSQYNRSAQKAYELDTPFFKEAAQRLLVKDPTKREYRINPISKLANNLLDKPFMALGDKIETSRRAGSSLFKGSDFSNVKALVDKLQSGATPFSKRIGSQVTAAAGDALNSGNEARMRTALAKALNELIETNLYDDKPLSQTLAEYWDARRLWEKAVEDKINMEQSGYPPAAIAQIEQIIAARKQTLNAAIEKRKAESAKTVAQLEAEGVRLSSRLRDYIYESPQSSTRMRLNRLLLEAAFPDEIAGSIGGVYPDLEMYISSPMDSKQCFDDYLKDARRRLQVGQLRPGEDVRMEGGRIQVSGQVAVMAINALLTKNMFENNPNNEFFVEESFPLEWMYPHLTPFGVIMKINRQPLPALSEEIMQRDHEFWAKYSERLIGNWITYDTPVQEIANFAEKVYLRRDFSGFKGDRRFVRDDQAQKAFSKLRSSIAGIYAWRLGWNGAPITDDQKQYLPRTQEERDRLVKEADFAFKQAFAFCPYSPEAVFRYMQVLMNTGRLEDAILVLKTALKLDPYNVGLRETLTRIQGQGQNSAKIAEMRAAAMKFDKEWKDNPSNYQAALNLAGALFNLGQQAAGAGVLDDILKRSNVPPEAVIAVADYHISTRNLAKLEESLQRLTEVTPGSPEAWYDLAALKATLGKNNDAIRLLGTSLSLDDSRRKTNPQARDLRVEAGRDARFQAISQAPEFKALVKAP